MDLRLIGLFGPRASLASAIRAWLYYQSSIFEGLVGMVQQSNVDEPTDKPLLPGLLLYPFYTVAGLVPSCAYFFGTWISLMGPSIELVLIIVCACMPTLKPIYNHHFRRYRMQQRVKTHFPAIPTGRPKEQSYHHPLAIGQNEDPAISLSSFPLSQPSNAAQGDNRMEDGESQELRN